MTDAYRVLYVDDEPSLLEITRIFLESEGDFSVDTLTSANEALKLLKTRQYDAIISDYQMPEMDGITFLKQLKASGNTTPFIVYTGRGREEVVIEALNNGADFYLQKGGESKAQFVELSNKVRYAIKKRQAENALAESEEKFRTIFENSPYPISINSIPDGKFIAVNAAFLQSSGYPEAEVLGKTPIEMGMLSFLDFGRLSSHLVLSGRLENVPMVLVGKGGKRVHVQFSTLPVTINNRSAILTVTVEVTKLKRAEEELHQKNQELAAAFEELTASEEELRQNYDQLAAFQINVQESEARFRTLFEISPDGIILFDLTGRITIASTEALRVFRVSSMDEAVGTSVFDWVEPEYHELVRKTMVELLDRKFRHAVTYRVRRRDGSSFFVESSHGIFPGADGRPDGFIVIVRDITDRQQAEMALRESEEKFRKIFENTSLGMTLALPDFRFLLVNPAWVSMMGHTEEEFRKMSFKDITHPDDLAGDIEGIRALEAGTIPEYSTEKRYVRKDGSTLWGALKVTTIRNEDGTLRFYLAQIEDITPRRLAEERLSEVNRAFLSFSPDPISNINILTGLAGRMLRGTCALYNRIEGGMLCSLGMWNTPADFVSCDLPEGHICNDVILEGDSSPAIITNLMTSSYADTDPNVRRYQLQTYIGIPVKIGEKFLGSLCVVYRDIYSPSPQELEILSFLAQAIAIEDERRTATQALRVSEERFRTILHSLQSGIVIIDPRTHTILDANPKALEMIGGNSESVSGSVCHRFICPAESSQCPVTDLGQAIESSERVLLNQQGERLPILKSVSRTILGGKEVLIESFVDITDRKLAEEALRQANKKLNLLSAITRHDISNQLLALNGFLELLHARTPDPALDDYFTRIADTCTRISTMIEFTKDYEKIGVNAPLWHDCRALVDTAAKETLRAKVMVKNDIPAGTEVFADPLIAKVFYNLMDNAVRYGGKITAVRFTVHEQDGNQIIVCEDDGDGVPADDKERIFARGFGKNSGLGLALSREILDITGISIRETGYPGKGARFEIVVPKGMWRVAGRSA
ncbi:MAG: PAS domain S-box protein [Methanoregula sp.]|jgi:PAS domain S-box-containing protein|uniref:PAS domain S-box protein n=1 Tax=Methanoregula sp. TaxID=2052170 RepID=UPI003D117C09